jgi:hypothetical protein
LRVVKLSPLRLSHRRRASLNRDSVPGAVEVQSFAVRTSRLLFIASHFSSPTAELIATLFSEEKRGTLNLHELQPFLDLAGRGATLLAGWFSTGDGMG